MVLIRSLAMLGICHTLTGLFLFLFYFSIYVCIFFPTVQHGGPVTHTCIHIFSPIVMLHRKYLDIVLSAKISCSI